MKFLFLLGFLALFTVSGCERQMVLVPESSDVDYVFETITVPDVEFLELTASSDFEDYAGNTLDAAGKKVGFTFIDGVFSTYSFPEATETLFYALSNTGEAAGHYKTKDRLYHGVLLKDGKLERYDFPGATETFILGISDATGALTGSFIGDDRTVRGFSGDQIIEFPGASATFADFVNASGAIVGSYRDANDQYHGYVRTPDGAFESFNLPHPPDISEPDLRYLYVHGINDAGAIVFRAQAVGDVPRAYIVQPGGTPQELKAPGSTTTEVWNINQDGSLVGHYDTPDGRRHGFIARPAH